MSNYDSREKLLTPAPRAYIARGLKTIGVGLRDLVMLSSEQRLVNKLNARANRMEADGIVDFIDETLECNKPQYEDLNGNSGVDSNDMEFADNDAYAHQPFTGPDELTSHDRILVTGDLSDFVSDYFSPEIGNSDLRINIGRGSLAEERGFRCTFDIPDDDYSPPDGSAAAA
tara:strand:- start:864 stop:1379 length:516 start_codon:yes stop_codon:yes gene_type:complete